MFTLADLKATKVYQERKLENTRQIAKNMLVSGMSVVQIVKFTGLTAEQVHQL